MNNSQPMECRYCHALGHSKNNCPKLQSKKPAADTPEPKSILLARKQNSTTKVVEKKSTFENDFPSLGGSKTPTKSSTVKKTTMNFLATITNVKTQEIEDSESMLAEEKTIIHNGIVMSVL